MDGRIAGLVVMAMLAPRVPLAVHSSFCESAASKKLFIRRFRDGAATPMIEVERGQGRSSTIYTRSDAGFERAFPKNNPSDFNGQRVLDMGCGGGRAVKELRAAGVEAFGIDLIIEPRDKSLGYLVEGDALETEFPSRSFDQIYSVGSLFCYNASDDQMMKIAFKEAYRLLDTHGILTLREGNVDRLVPNIGKFKIVESASGLLILKK
jgi:SAM-dependent methyltransferase